MPRVDIGDYIPNLLSRPEMQTAEGRVEYFRGQFSLSRPADLTPELEEYHDFIEDKLDDSFARMSPDFVMDRTKLNAVACVDGNVDNGITGIFSDEITQDLLEPENRVPGGLYFLHKTRLMAPWVAARMFNKYLIGAQHTGCGALKLAVGTDQQVIQVMRRDAADAMDRLVNDQAAMIRAFWRATMKGPLDPEVEAAIDSFNGPLFRSAPVTEGGTAAAYIQTRRGMDSLHSYYSATELLAQGERWIEDFTSGTVVNGLSNAVSGAYDAR